MRLIDADALINEIMTEWGCDPKFFEKDEDATVALAAFSDVRTLERIAKAPTADAEPVKHGKWERANLSVYEEDDSYICSVCGNIWMFIDGTPKENNANYCPNCGAKMEVEK